MKRWVIAALVCAAMAAGVPGTGARAQTPGPRPEAFALQPTDFPEPAAVVTSRVETNVLADGEQSIVHFGAKFSSEGRTTGYLMSSEQDNVEPSGAMHPVDTAYLVSIFRTAVMAAAAFGQQRDGWENLILHPNNGVSAAVSPLSGPAPGDLSARGVYTAATPTPQGQAAVAELLFVRGVSLIEIFQAYLSKDASPYGAAARPFLFSIGQKLDTVASADGQTATPAPNKKADFSILTVRVEKDRAKPDLTKPALTAVTAGAIVRFSTYFTVTAPASDRRVMVAFTLTLDGKSTRHTFTRPLTSGPASYYRYSLRGITLKAGGMYTLTGTITMGGVSHSGSTVFTVTGGRLVNARRSESGVSRLLNRCRLETRTTTG